MSADTLTRGEHDLDRSTDPLLGTERAKNAHIVKTEPGENAAAKVMQARIEGTAVEALCGFVFVPQQDPTRLALCPVCKEVYDLNRLFSDNSLNESPTNAYEPEVIEAFSDHGQDFFGRFVNGAFGMP